MVSILYRLEKIVILYTVVTALASRTQGHEQLTRQPYRRPQQRRALQRQFPLAGQTLREVIQAWPSNLNVGVACSGAISGDIGGPSARNGPAGPPDHDWVTHVVGRMQRGEIDELLNEASLCRLCASSLQSEAAA